MLNNPVTESINLMPDPETIWLRTGRHPMTGSIAGILDRHDVSTSVEPPVIAFSGGADSLCMLLVASAIRRRHSVAPPLAVHVDHGLRAGSEEDADFCECFCKLMDLPFQCARLDLDPDSGNVHDMARRARYEVLTEQARSSGSVHVLTGHHADDQLETMLMNISRGCLPSATAGMPQNRPLDDHGTMLLRPLLAVPRLGIEQFCTECEVSFRTDPSNSDPSSPRTRLRHEVLPVLEQLWPGAASRASMAAEGLRVGERLFQQHVVRLFGSAGARSWSRHVLAHSEIPVIIAGLLRSLRTTAQADPSRTRLRDVAVAIRSDDRTPRQFPLGSGRTCIVTASRVIMQEESLTDKAVDDVGS